MTASFSSLLLLAALLRWKAFHNVQSFFMVLLAFLIPFAAAFLRKRDPGSTLQTVSDFAPMVSVLLIFDNLGPFIQAVNPVDRDSWLIAADRFLTGTDPTRWLESFASPILSDLLTVCYSLFFFHPLVLGALIYKKDSASKKTGAAREFPRFAFTAIFAFFLSYTGYFIVPATGPRFTIEHAGPLVRGPISTVLDQTMNTLETNKRNCFPSGHTLVVLVVLVEAWRSYRKMFWVLLPLVAGLILATVYGRYHYLTDVIAGLLLTAPTVWFSRWLGGKLLQRTEGTGRQSSR